MRNQVCPATTYNKQEGKGRKKIPIRDHERVTQFLEELGVIYMSTHLEKCIDTSAACCKTKAET